LKQKKLVESHVNLASPIAFDILGQRGFYLLLTKDYTGMNTELQSANLSKNSKKLRRIKAGGSLGTT
jgi:hypothetical protein